MTLYDLGVSYGSTTTDSAANGYFLEKENDNLNLNSAIVREPIYYFPVWYSALLYSLLLIFVQIRGQKFMQLFTSVYEGMVTEVTRSQPPRVWKYIILQSRRIPMM